MEAITPVILALIGAYLALGIPVGIAFIARGVDRIDPGMAASPKRVRLVILPGAIALWPILLAKWIRAPKHPHPAKAVRP
jgi:hypothetical protein